MVPANEGVQALPGAVVDMESAFRSINLFNKGYKMA